MQTPSLPWASEIGVQVIQCHRHQKKTLAYIWSVSGVRNFSPQKWLYFQGVEEGRGTEGGIWATPSYPSGARGGVNES